MLRDYVCPSCIKTFKRDFYTEDVVCCSRACAGKIHSIKLKELNKVKSSICRETRKCKLPSCNVVYLTYKNVANAKKYCSKECRSKHLSDIGKCKPSFYNKSGPEAVNWKGGIGHKYANNHCSCGASIGAYAEYCTKCKNVGSLNPMYGKKNPCSQEVKDLLSQKLSGAGNPRWLGGITEHPYPIEFNDELREKIRIRDNHTCQICKRVNPDLELTIPRVLQVHHIDYNKENHAEANLISLCVSCHMKTNANREYWLGYFKNTGSNYQFETI